MEKFKKFYENCLGFLKKKFSEDEEVEEGLNPFIYVNYLQELNSNETYRMFKDRNEEDYLLKGFLLDQNKYTNILWIREEFPEHIEFSLVGSNMKFLDTRHGTMFMVQYNSEGNRLFYRVDHLLKKSSPYTVIKTNHRYDFYRLSFLFEGLD